MSAYGVVHFGHFYFAVELRAGHLRPVRRVLGGSRCKARARVMVEAFADHACRVVPVTVMAHRRQRIANV
jgi:hypothetical protein